MANPDSTLFGTPGPDNLVGTDPGNDLIVGSSGNDNISGLGGADTLDGGDGNDFLNGGAGNDVLLGGAGGDTLVPGAGSDTVDGGAILDRTNYTDGNTVSFVDATAAVTLDLAAGTATSGADVDQLHNVNFVLGSDFGDSLKGSAEFNLFEQFEGRAGNDTIDGGAIDGLGTGSNRATYNNAPGAVNVDLGAGTAQDGYGTTDTLININHVRGSSFDDTLTGSDATSYTEAFEGRGGNDLIDGKGGTDQVRYDSATTGVNVNLATGQASDGLGGTDTLLHIEGVRGSNFNDTLTGSDTTGRTGVPGDFEFFAGMAGNDFIDGGAGFDRADYTTATNGVHVDLGTGIAQDGQGGTDTLVGIEAVRGSDLNDGLFGSDTAPFESFEGRAGNDFIDGRGGVDRLDYQSDYGAVSVDMRFGIANDGFGGTDTFQNIERIRGSTFNDSIIGAGGNETLEGAAGNDTLSGVAGNDTFLYLASGGAGAQGRDLITDFNAGDVIELRTGLTAGSSTAGDGSTVSGKGVQVSTAAGITTLAIDLDGVAGADLRIDLAGTYDPAGFSITNNGAGSSFISYTSATAPIGTRVNGFPSLSGAPDSLNGGAGDDALAGGRGDDSISGNDGNDTLTGGDGNDTLLGGNGNDVLLGGTGSDTLNGGPGSDTLDGGAITDRVNYTDLNFSSFSGATVGVNINLQAGTAVAGTDVDTLVDINFVQGSNQNDTITGSSTFNLFEQFEGLAGNDTIDGGAIDALQTNGNRVTYQNAPAAVNVTLGGLATGTAQDGYGTTDTLVNINFARGSNFNDTLTGSDVTAFTEFFDGRGGNDLIDGRGGIDIARYDGANAAVNVDLAAGTATDLVAVTNGIGNDTLIGIEGVRGSNFGDVLTGGNAASDAIEIFQGNGGNDTIDGGTGFDRVDYTTATFGVNVDLSQGTAVDGQGGFDTLRNIEGVRGSELGDVLIGSDNPGLETFEGRAGDDLIDGRGGVDRVDYQNDWSGVQVNLQNNIAFDGQGGTDRLFNIENVRGSSFNDTITGSNVDNVLQGNAGDDLLEGLGGNDTIDGGAGNDTVSYENAFGGVFVDLQNGNAGGAAGNDSLANIENVRGSAFDDNLNGSDVANVLQGGGGNDFITPGAGDDLVDGGSGSDTVNYENASAGVSINLKTGQATGTSTGTDTLVSIENAHGSNFGDTIITTDAGAFIMGRGGNDSLVGGLGNDNFVGGSGNDTIVGTAGGNDGVAYFDDGFDGAGAGTQGVVVNLGAGTATDNWGNTDTLVNIQAVTGSGQNDTLIGSAGNNFIDGNAGNDSIDGGAGFDNVGFGSSATGGVTVNLIAGTATGAGIGSDTLVNIEGVSGTNFDDVIQLGNTGGNAFGADGNDAITGGNGNDFITGARGNDTINGGAGVDTADYSDAFGAPAVGVNVNLATGIAIDNWGTTDTLSNIENVIGTSQNDTLVGNGADNSFTAAAGNDFVDGGAGRDTIVYDGVGSSLNVNLLTGNASGAAIGNDTLVGIENAIGSRLNDTITLGNSAGSAIGRGGNDTLVGGGGDDFFQGGSGSDSISGGAGFDTIDYNPDFDNAGVPLTGHGVTVNLATGTATDNWGNTDTFTGIELVRGSNLDDLLVGGNPANGSGDTDGFEGFTGQGGNDTIDGGAGFDRAQYDTSPNAVNVTLGGTSNGTAQDGFGGVDTLISIEEVRGSNFNDTLTGSDTGIFESFEGRGGNDLIDGRGGVDRVSYQTSGAGVNVNLAGGTAQDGFGGTDTLRNIENIRGSDFNDTLAGDAGANDIEARLGNDLLQGGAGQDTLRGGAGDDTLDGGSNVILTGWDATANVSGEVDIASYGDAGGAVNVDLGVDGTAGTATGAAGNDTLVDIEMVIGSSFGDVIRGSNRAENEVIRGGAGDDTLFGGAATGTDAGNNFVDYRFASGAVNVNLATNSASGADGNDQLSGFQGVFGSTSGDTLTGDAANNFLEGEQGDDVLDGGAGARDAASYMRATGGVNVSLATGLASGADGNDTLTGIEDLRGSEFADTLTGDAGDNQIQGRAGNDVIDGGAGNDSLHGGFGDDTLTGGTGNDTFQFGASGEGTDTINDFARGDVIRIAAPVTAAGVQVAASGGVTTLSIDTDGVAGADMQVKLVGTFAAGDFNIVQANGATQITLNEPVQGTPAIDGLVQEDQVLTANTSGLSDGDGLGAFSFQWLRDGVAVSGATAGTYTLGDADVGHHMSVGVSYIDGKGHAESATSAATAAVANVNDVPTGSVTITGTPAEDQVLTASNNLADADGLGTIGYQWFANGTAIANATGNTLTLTQAEVGKTITVAASYTDLQGHAESVASAATATVANVNDAPQGAITLSGTAAEDSTLTAVSTVTDEDGLGTFSYQWFANGSAIANATGNTLTLTQAEVGKTITVAASYTDLQGHAESVASAASAPVQNVNDAPTGSLAITGFTGAEPSKGQTLSVLSTLADEDGIPAGGVTFEWLRGTSVVATGAQYTLTQQDVGAAITVRGSYTDNFGHAESVSSPATGAVLDNQPPTGNVTIAGTFQQGATLTASQNLADPDGLGPVTFQWLANGSPIANATGTTFTLTEAQVGQTVSVQASYTDGLGTHESVSSTGNTVANVNDPLTGDITISNTAPKQGDVLTASNTFGDLDGLGSVSYQWFANGTAITGANGTTFTPGQAQVGQAITVRGSYVDGHGTAEGRTSAPTAVVANVNDAPTGQPAISGTPAQGQTLSADTAAIADADGLGAFSFQWLAGGAVIEGATSSSFTLTQAEVDKAVTVQVSYTDGFGAAEHVVSAPTTPVANVNDDPVGAVKVDGARVVGMPLQADTSAVSDLDGLGTFSFQWLRAGAVIDGATAAAYTPIDADASQDISVQVSYTDLFGHAETLASAAVPVVNEDLVPVLVVNGVASIAGDGNGDGIKDSLQEAVVSAPLVVQDATGTAQPVFVTLVADASASGAVNQNSTAAIQTLNQEAAPAEKPATLNAPLGLIDFTAATTVGKTETFTLFVDSSLGVNGYWKQDGNGTWVNLASTPFGGATTQVGNKTRLDFKITDGGTFDNDHHQDGIITDPAVIGAMPLSVVGYTPDVTLTPTTHFFF